MFVGSERMNSIYQNLLADLNKWINSSLDRLEEEADCAALLTEPVAGKIEYEPDAVKHIVGYCLGNPFYMHLVAGKVFRRCAQERRTFVGTSDFEYVRRSLVRELGPTNFAHFWEDVPVLEPGAKQRCVGGELPSAGCVATLVPAATSPSTTSSTYRNSSDWNLGNDWRRRICGRWKAGLVRRRVLSRQRGGGRGIDVELPVFRDWLLENGETELLPVWRSFQEELAAKGSAEEPAPFAVVESSAFPIDEDELPVGIGASGGTSGGRRTWRRCADGCANSMTTAALRWRSCC